jgi:hypothetical protein
MKTGGGAGLGAGALYALPLRLANVPRCAFYPVPVHISLGRPLHIIHYRTISSHHLTCPRRKETESMHHVVNRIVYTVPVECLLSTFVAYTYLLYILYIYTRQMHV